MEINTTSYVCQPLVPAAAGTAHGLGWTSEVRAQAPTFLTVQGTGLSSAMRDRTATNGTDAPKTRNTALLPIKATDEDYVFGAGVGFRSWSPPG